MRVLLVLPYAWDLVPGQRYRIEQWASWLRERGVDLQVSSLLSREDRGLLYRRRHFPQKALLLLARLGHRVRELRGAGDADAIWLHRAAFPVGPAFLERWLARSGVPIIYEFDDAIYIADTTQANRRFRFLKCSGKTADICRLSRHIVVGNEYLAQYARQFNPNVTVIPTTIDTDAYQPCAAYRESAPVVIGWSGSQTTVAHLRTLDTALQRVAAMARVRVRVIGTGSYPLPGLDVQASLWSSDTECLDLSQIDIGVMPLPDAEWARGKCALKALQYMALGIPTVVSPVGVNSEIIGHGVNGFLAGSEEEWVECLMRLVHDVRLRERLGRAGRRTVEQRYSASVQAPHVLALLQQVCGERVPSVVTG